MIIIIFPYGQDIQRTLMELKIRRGRGGDSKGQILLSQSITVGVAKILLNLYCINGTIVPTDKENGIQYLQ